MFKLPWNNLQLASDSEATISLMGAGWILWIFVLASMSYLSKRKLNYDHNNGGGYNISFIFPCLFLFIKLIALQMSK
ncbi:hypothetical protein M5689_005935 [Euphorbia peplus]|nr:hypothetical protein M5689_005935 [Euphorbia peplus]